ncbi:MAG: MlaD family protein [Balneolaceae bacterium]
MNLNSEVKIGITVFLAAVAAVIGFRFMSDVPVFRSSQQVTATFERVDGLGTGSEVLLRGVRVGSVSEVTLTESDSVQIRMRLDLRNPLPKDSQAYLTSIGLIEGKSIVLRLGESEETIEEGGEIAGYYEDSMMEAISSQGEEFAGDISNSFTELNDFLNQLNSTLDDEASNNISSTFTNVERTTKNLSDLLDEKKSEIDSAIQSGSSMMNELDTMAATNRPKVDSLMTSLEYNIRELEKVRVEIESASMNLNQILEKINNGEGTLGRLVNDPGMYENLDELSAELTELVRGINEEPGKYLKHMSIIELF